MKLEQRMMVGRPDHNIMVVDVVQGMSLGPTHSPMQQLDIVEHQCIAEPTIKESESQSTSHSKCTLHVHVLIQQVRILQLNQNQYQYISPGKLKARIQHHITQHNSL